MYLIRENYVWGVGWVNTVGLEWNQELSSVFQVHVAVLSNDSCLIWLGNVSEHTIDHTDQKSVILRFSGVMNDWDDVGSLLGHVNQVSSDSVGELNCIDKTFWANDIRNVGNSSSWGGTEIQNLGSWEDTGFGNTTDDWSSDFGSVRIPDSVFDFLSIDFDADSLFIINAFSWD